MGAEQNAPNSIHQPEIGNPDTAAVLEIFINSRPETRGIFGQIEGDLLDGIYLSKSALSPDITAENLPQLISVIPLLGARLGAGDSQHQVAFGDAELSVGTTTATVEVAIKPFEETVVAAHEHDCFDRVRNRGLNTFRPLAIGINGGVSYLITERRRDIKTFDNDDWTVSPHDPAYEETVKPNLQFAAEYMATLHAMGIFHGDMQPKNIARTDTGDAFYIDFELTSIADSHEDLEKILKVQGDIRDSKAFYDVYQFWYTLTHPNPLTPESQNIFLVGEDFETCMAAFKNDLLEPYLSAIRKQADGATLDAFRLEEMEDMLYKRVSQTT